MTTAIFRDEYFRQAAVRSHLKRLYEWLRRKLRCVRVKQRKRGNPIAELLRELAPVGTGSRGNWAYLHGAAGP
jgi:hypothetical protein